MATTQTPILILGATGYIGGSILARLLDHPNASSFDITVFVRDEKKAGIAESKFGLKAVVGTLADEEKLESLAENAHVIFSCADNDDLKAIQAVLRGLKKRGTNAVGDLPVLVHTSGTGVLLDQAKGLFPTETIYDDMNPDQIESLPDSQPHRHVDLAIVKADSEGYLRSYIILPGTVYGRPLNPLVEAGFQKTASVQIPALIRASADRGQGGVVGKGLAIWPSIDIDDVADLHVALFNAIVAHPDKVGHGREGFYFGESGEHTWYSISKRISEVLVELGLGKSDEPTTFTTEELSRYFISEDIGNSFGSNSRCRANRSHSLGWSPKKTTPDMLASIKPEVETLLGIQK